MRRRAFGGDFFAQIELGRRYTGWSASDKNIADPIEASVWYALALANPQGYQTFGPQRSAPAQQGRYHAPPAAAGDYYYDGCRAGERSEALRRLNILLAQMSSDERDKIRNRVIYVLSTQGAEGLRTLARISDDRFGPFGEPFDDDAPPANVQPAATRAVDRLFEPNDVDAYIYDYLAMQSGDTAAYILLQDGRWGRIADVGQARARRWSPPYEFYPPDALGSGAPHSDESSNVDEATETALGRIDQLPFQHVSEALTYLHVSQRVIGAERLLPTQDAEAFKAMLGRPAGDCLTPLEKVRAIQYAATNGSPRAQLVLAVMYAEGVGVPTDYARAFHWFEQADRQGSPEAKFAIASYFSEGLPGVADQDKAKAVVYQLDSALSGFRPSIGRMRTLLARVSPGGQSGWIGYGSRYEDIYSPNAYGPDAGPAPPQSPSPPRDLSRRRGSRPHQNSQPHRDSGPARDQADAPGNPADGAQDLERDEP